MKKYRLTITEKEKLISSFNLSNFRDEIVNFMYKRTVADASRKSMVFYVVVFFLSISHDGKSLMRDLFDRNLKKFRELNKLLEKKKRLKKGEYADLIHNAGLTEVFRYDVFFLLITAIVDAEGIKRDFRAYFDKSPALEKEFDEIVTEYGGTFDGFREEFSKYQLVDDRWDGEHYRDLSKSVIRPVKMRTSRHIDLTLHKYAEVKKITSESPVVVQVIQNIDPEILIRIWEVYNLDVYAKGVWNVVNTPFVSAFGSVVAAEWVKWRFFSGRTEKKEKAAAKKSLDIAKTNAAESGETDALLSGLVNSVLSTNEYLKAEINKLQKELKKVRSEASILVNRDKEIKDLEERVMRLDNISIEIQEE